MDFDFGCFENVAMMGSVTVSMIFPNQKFDLCTDGSDVFLDLIGCLSEIFM